MSSRLAVLQQKLAEINAQNRPHQFAIGNRMKNHLRTLHSQSNQEVKTFMHNHPNLVYLLHSTWRFATT